MTDLDRPSLAQILVHDMLLSGVGGLLIAALLSLRDVAWYWPLAVLFGVAGLTDLVGRLFPEASAVSAKWFKDRVTAIYERAEGDRAFHLRYQRKNIREGIIYYCISCGCLFVSIVPLILGFMAAIGTSAWAHENWRLVMFIAIVLSAISIAMTYRLAAFAAVRIEEGLTAKRPR